MRDTFLVGSDAGQRMLTSNQHVASLCLAEGCSFLLKGPRYWETLLRPHPTTLCPPPPKASPGSLGLRALA